MALKIYIENDSPAGLNNFDWKFSSFLEAALYDKSVIRYEISYSV